MTNVSSMIDLYDTDMLAIDKGPVAWMARKQGTAMDLEDFRRAVSEQFEDIGLRVSVKPFETTERGTYAFDIEINGRCEHHNFDFDQMVHEVQHNILDEPGPAVVNTKQAMADFRSANPDAHKGHGPGCVR